MKNSTLRSLAHVLSFGLLCKSRKDEGLPPELLDYAKAKGEMYQKPFRSRWYRGSSSLLVDHASRNIRLRKQKALSRRRAAAKRAHKARRITRLNSK